MSSANIEEAVLLEEALRSLNDMNMSYFVLVIIIIISPKFQNFSRRYAARRIRDAPLLPRAHNDVMIFRFEDILL